MSETRTTPGGQQRPHNPAVAWLGERRKLIPAVLGMVLSWAVLVGWVDPISMEVNPDFVLTWQAAAGGIIQLLLGVIGVERIGNRTYTEPAQ